MRTKFLLWLIVIFVVVLGATNDGKSAPVKSRLPAGSDCTNGQWYLLLPGPYGNGWYVCVAGGLYGPQ